MSNRRDFLRNVSFLTAGGLLAGNVGSLHASTTTSSQAAAAKTIGLQTYSLGQELFKDVPGGMKKLKDMGYTNLELAGYSKEGKIGPVEMMEFKKMAEDAGLKITSSHVNPAVREFSKETFSDIKEFWKVAAEHHAKLGVKYLIQPMMPKCESHADAAFLCEVFNASGAIVKEAGIPWGYHNHNMEFKRVVKPEDAAKPGNPWMPKGDQIYDLFLKDTDPSLVFFEMDVYWTVMGQNDPVEYMRKHPDRIKVLHIKDRAIFGQSGMMNFEMIFKQAYANGIKDYFVELEGLKDGMSQFDGVKGCVDYLLNAPFVK